MKKFAAAILTATMMTTILSGCGKNDSDTTALPGTCAQLLAQVYETADLDQEVLDAMQYYQNVEISEDNEEYILGTDEIDYTDSVYSAPQMSSVAYQCVLLRLAEDQDAEEAKKLLTDNADPRKWVCVEAESVIVENSGDVVLYIMADTDTAAAIQTAFQALATQ